MSTRIHVESDILQANDKTLQNLYKNVKNNTALNLAQLMEYYTGYIYLIENNKSFPNTYEYNCFNRYFSTACGCVCCVLPCLPIKMLTLMLRCCCWKNKCVDCMDECTNHCMIEPMERTWSNREVSLERTNEIHIDTFRIIVLRLINIIKKDGASRAQINNSVILLNKLYERYTFNLSYATRRVKENKTEMVDQIMQEFNRIPGFLV